MIDRMRIALALLLATGQIAAAAGYPDQTFGTGGVTVVPSAGVPFSIANGLSIDGTGRIVAVGATGLAPLDDDLLAFRLLPDGTLDAAFGTSGTVVLPLPAGQGTGRLERVAHRPDGRIVAAGTNFAPASNVFVVMVGFEADGTLDDAFGDGGLLFFDEMRGSPLGLVVQPDGLIVIAGGSDPVVMRLDPSGDPDPTFGVGGVAAFPTLDRITDMVRQPDGALVVAGEAAGDVAVARLLSDGTLDPAFGTGGIVITDVGSFDYAQAVALQADGAIVVGGAQSPSSRAVLLRHLSDGTLDATFGDGGVVSYAGAPGVSDLVVQTDGSLVIVGTYASGGPTTILDHELNRFFADGSVDETFFHDVTFGGSALGQLALQADSKIVAGGLAVGSPTSFSAQVRRYHGLGACGNGVVEPGEDCDDPSNPCCVLCRTDTLDPCDDGDLCTDYDFCNAGVCMGFPRWTTEPCLQCDPTTGDFAGIPRTGCKQTTVPRRSKLVLKDATSANGDTLTWKWSKGAATTVAELGDPLSGTYERHDLCIFDESGPSPVLVLATAATSECADAGCWTAKGNRLLFKQRTPNAFGVTSMTLAAGAAGKSSMSVKAKGPALFAAGSPLPLGTPLRVQLGVGPRLQFGAPEGACWEATFSPSGVRSSTATRFVGTSD